MQEVRMITVILALIGLLTSKALPPKQKKVVEYIHSQRKNGHKDARIRAHMEKHGYPPETVQTFFSMADQERHQQKVKGISFVLLLIGLLVGGLFVLGEPTITAAPTWWWSSYECGDEGIPTDEAMDLSECVGDTAATEKNLFCYINNDLTIEEDISPSGVNDDWYSSNVDEDISATSTIDSVDLLESRAVYPYTSSYDNMDCFEWDHGTTRSSGWHTCNEPASGTDYPSNLVFYYVDSGDLSDGIVSTGTDPDYEVSYESSYYVCYDELSCVTQTTACDETADEYCVGRMSDPDGSAWYSCDTELDADYYRCCTSACEESEMMCGGYLLSQDGMEEVPFSSCVEDGTSACCDDATDCVYDGACYDYLQQEYFYDMKMQCREDSTWCPDGFEYDSRADLCIPQQEACYDSSDEAYCNSAFTPTPIEDLDSWEADSGCVRDDPDSIVYKEACIPTILEGLDYYFYEDITYW